MSMKEEYTAIDMSTAAADGFRDGQRAAQSAPAGESEAFREWSVKVGAAYVTENGYTVWKHDNECGEFCAFKAGAAWQRTQSAGVPEGWRDALQKIARHAPPVNCAAKTEVEKLALIAVHALIAFSAPQFSKPTDHQSAKVGTAAPVQPAAQGEFGNAYQGAREDLAIWKRRALEAEARVRQQDQIIDQMGEDLNAINGPTFMGEPVIPAAQDQGEVLTEHSGCGRGIQVDQLTVRMYPGDKVVMVRGRIGKALAASTGQEVKP